MWRDQKCLSLEEGKRRLRIGGLKRREGGCVVLREPEAIGLEGEGDHGKKFCEFCYFDMWWIDS